MCETPKDEAELEETSNPKTERRSYYYDDALGYEDFDSESDEIDADEEESA